MLCQSSRDDASKIVPRNWTYCRLSPTGNISLFVQDTALDHAIGTAERNRIDEVEIAARCDHGEVHPRCLRVRNNLLDFCDREVSACFGHSARLVVDNPISDTGLDATEILIGKLVTLSGAVVVNRICAMDEDPESHATCIAPFRSTFIDGGSPALLNEMAGTGPAMTTSAHEAGYYFSLGTSE